MTDHQSISPDLLSAALDYASKGLPVFPCDGEKHPRVKGGFKSATTDAAQIRQWWARWPDAMIGMPAGEATGVWVLDIDDPEVFEAECPIELPMTQRCDTGKGYHLYFKFDPANPVSNRQCTAQQKTDGSWPIPKLPGAETRGEGGYVIVPPSLHPSGKRYTWATDFAPADASHELLQIVAERAPKANNPPPNKKTFTPALTGSDKAYGLAALEGECAAIRSAGNGAQEGTLNQAAFNIGGLVAGGELSMATAKGRLLSAGLAMPSYNSRNQWTADAVVAKVERGMSDGAAHPRSAPVKTPHRQARVSQYGEDCFDPETGEVSLEQRDEGRRENQRRENQEIGEGTNVVPTAKILTLDDMVDNYVFILQGSQVAPLSCPQSVLALQDFKNAMAGSKHWVRPEDSKPKALPVVSCWLEHQDRKEADTITFRAGGDLIIAAPNSNRPALNMWSPFKRPAAPADWESLAGPFVEHVRWLWGQDADKFLDWLAHIEQFPGVLPHYGWVHISRQHGKGRNWISSVLARVWRGYVAASLDLVAMLEGKFNGRLSRKILAIVDEINEGGNASYRHAQTLRQLVTAEHREINPKYGKQHVEYNSCRWLLFSNHAGAIPLTEDDRRFWVVSHDGDAKPPAYYSKLYGALADPAFIASVTEFLRRRNIDGFMPGERPPMNEAKAALVAVGQNEDHLTLKEVSDKWPVDLITNYEIAGLLEGGGSVTASVRLTLSDLDFRRIEQKVKVWGQGPQRVYAIRNHAYWMAATHEARKTEIDRIAEGDKREAIGRGL